MKARLSKRVIDEAEYQGPVGCYLWDADLAGYGVRIYPSGWKSFVITYRARGRRRFHTLGRYGELTPHQAHPEALERLAAAREGNDLAGERLAARKASTVAGLADRLIGDPDSLRADQPRRSQLEVADLVLGGGANLGLMAPTRPSHQLSTARTQWLESTA